MSEYKICVKRGSQEVMITGTLGESLMEALQDNEIYLSAACGGKGKCGKCGVKMTEGATAIMAEDRRFFEEDELAAGWRLSCLAYPESDCSIAIDTGDESDFEIVSDYQDETRACDKEAESGYDIAIDIGTTTIAVSLVGKDSKSVIHTVTTVNRQRAYGADVISRIQASVDGKGEELKASIRKDLHDSILKLVAEANVSLNLVGCVAIAGNTTMGHLLMGFSCESLGVAPFTPVDIGTIHDTYTNMFAGLAKESEGTDIKIVLLPGVSTYVGADITAGMLSTGFDHSDTINVLVDLGTNGEMAIGNKDNIMVTSTAAGPAFEGGNISCGMGSVQGAICQIEINGTDVSCETIGGKAPIGLCGTGVLETVYELIKEEWLDETGMLDEDYFDDGFPLGTAPNGEEITFTQKDVREIQLAKSAVRAGLETLILRYGVTYDQIDKLYVAGGFGYRMNMEKAIGIGLLPEEMADKIVAVGNSSLGGAVLYLTDPDALAKTDRIIETATEVGLATDKNFIQFYTDYMFFE